MLLVQQLASVGSLSIAAQVSTGGSEGHLAALRKWITATGGDVAPVSIDEVDGLRGGFIDTELKTLDTEFMRLPAALGLSDDPDELLTTPIGQAVGRSGLALLQPDAHLALRLLHEVSLGEASLWHDHIGVLPAHVQTARHLSDGFLLACQSDFVLEQSMLARKYASSVHTTLRRLLADGASGAMLDEALSEEQLGWALDMVHSRSFSVDVGARGVRRFMVPVIDMLNHDPAGAAQFTYDGEDEPPSFIVELKPGCEAPAAGEPLWLDYGKQSSEEVRTDGLGL